MMTAMIDTAKATQIVLTSASIIRSSAIISLNQRVVQPFHGTIEGSLLSLKAAPDMTAHDGRVTCWKHGRVRYAAGVDEAGRGITFGQALRGIGSGDAAARCNRAPGR